LGEEQDRIDEISLLVGDVFRPETLEIRKGSIQLAGTLLVEPSQALKALAGRLKQKELTPMLTKRGGKTILILARLRPVDRSGRPSVNLLLFLITIFTTLYAGSLWQSEGFVDGLAHLHRGIPFSFSLLFILGAHELGHFFVAKRMGIDATLPYFIPGPHLIGTFGAVIRIKSPIPNRRALVLMGAAGPFCGLAVAVPIALIGLRLSHPVTAEELEGGFVLGSSLLFSLLEKVSSSGLPGNQVIFLHPMAFAAWLGMFVTGLNLLPIGQLDGGHIAYAILGRAHMRVGLVFLGVLVAVGVAFRFFAYAFFGLLILLVGFRHPPPLDDVTPISFLHKAVAVAAMVSLVLTFVLQPFALR
jgi:membrane-associated protease RseP (regulator of RpoE activity)